MLKCKKMSVDFCVVGGGMAGIVAAISAARHGCKVALVHERPVLGGNASSEIRMWVSGANGENNRETGIWEEIALENLYRNPTKNYHIWDTVLYDFVKREKNITMLLNCTCMDAECTKDEYSNGRTIKIDHIKAYQMTTQTFWEISAGYFADCSGDSILAPLTGANYRYGREAASEFGEKTNVEVSDKMVMGMSCLIQGRETTEKIKFIPPEWSTKLSDEDVKNRPLYSAFNSTQNYWYLELGGNRDAIHETEEIKEELISLALGAWDYVKNSGEENTENWELEFLGFLPGKRESRRMCGEYIVTQRDIEREHIFEDTIAFGGWPLDDHFPGGFYHKGHPNTNYVTPAPYCLPYRALYSENVENLLFAGRNISMTHTAMSSVRVMATCSLLGQAVGSAVSVACKYNITPHDVYKNHLQELQEILMEDDCFLPHFTRTISDSCRNADLTYANEKYSINENLGCTLRNGKDRENRIYGEEKQSITIKKNSILEYKFSAPENVESVHIVFDSDLNRDSLPGDKWERTHSTRANVLLSSPQMHMPKTLCKEFYVEVESKDGTEKILCVKNNKKRSYHIHLDKSISALRLCVQSSWGESEDINIYSFDCK